MRLGAVAAEIADAAFETAAELAGRLLRHDTDRAAFGIAPEQRALRTAQDLDALDVEQGGVEALLAAEIDAIDIDADALVACSLVRVERHDAANADRQCRLAGFEGCNAQRRRSAITEVEQALDVAVFHDLRIDHRNRDRGLLQVGFALGRADDDFAEGARLRGARGTAVIFRILGGTRCFHEILGDRLFAWAPVAIWARAMAVSEAVSVMAERFMKV